MATGRPVIVTGAGGYVGWAVASHLAASGIPILGIVRSAIDAGFRWKLLDLEVDDLAPILAALSPQAVVHCAASVPLPALRPDDDAGAASTRAMDANVVRACSQADGRLIYMSSCILYDPLDPETKDERSPVRATTPYAAAKLDGEAQAGAVPGSVVMRLPSPVGGMAGRMTVLDRFVEQARKGEPLEVWGTGRREQDFIHVADIADFVTRTLSATVDGTYNVASGRPITMRDLADTIVDAVGSGSVVGGEHSDPQDGHTARYDIGAARRAVGWVPRTGIRAVIDDRIGRPR